MSDTKTKSSEQGLKRRKVIRTVKNGIVDDDLNETKDAYIAGWYLKRFTFYFLDLVFKAFTFMFFSKKLSYLHDFF